MSLMFALVLTQSSLALAILLQACEHRHATTGEQRLFALRAWAAAVLLVGIVAQCIVLNSAGFWGSSSSAMPAEEANRLLSACQMVRALACWAIFVLGVLSLKRFGGPYCGGSDLMTLQVSVCMAVAESSYSPTWRLGAAGYLSLQLCLSYWQSGWVKLINPHWRTGRALREVFAFTHYPVCEKTRRWAKFPRLLWVLGWMIMLVEFFFPLSLFSSSSLFAALVFMAVFHLANAWFFGLNRFFWIWLATYPTLIACQPVIAEFLRRQIGFI
jgi:hypothetical protein